MSDLPTKRITGLEIFSADVYANGDIYSTEDLDSMISAFDQVGFEPPVKCGHQNGQEDPDVATLLFGEPALGYVEKIYRKGKKLLADIRDIPSKSAALIQAGSYKRVSSEIYFNFHADGETFPFVLKAIAFLGADIPALTNLKAVEALFQSGAACFDDDENEYRIYTVDKPKQQTDERIVKHMDTLKFHDALERYARPGVDREAAAIIEPKLSALMAQGKSYSGAFAELRQEARKYEQDAAPAQDAQLEAVYRQWQRGDSQASKVMDAVFSTRAGRTGASYSDVMHGYGKIMQFANLPKQRIGNIINGYMHPDNGTLQIDRAVAAINRGSVSRSDAQQACLDELDHRLVKEIDIQGTAASDLMRPGVLEGVRRIVEEKYPAMAACAKGGAFTREALVELLPQYRHVS